MDLQCIILKPQTKIAFDQPETFAKHRYFFRVTPAWEFLNGTALKAISLGQATHKIPVCNVDP